MEKSSFLFVISLLFFLTIHALQVQATSSSPLETYIVHVQTPAGSSLSVEEREEWHRSFLPPHVARSGEPRLIYSYHHVMTGFAARLTKQELAEMEKTPGFLHAYPDPVLSLHTTRSQQFLGLHKHRAGLWNDSNYGQGVIIGVLDTGIDASLPSFRDRDHDGVSIPRPPPKWKGVCKSDKCNNKLIGLRNFVHPEDEDGDLRHGTHVASTAAGMFVRDVGIEGQAVGTASGAAPYAHLAIYKVCGANGCLGHRVVKGIEAAIEDGVDVISLSLGGGSEPSDMDPVATAAFGAMEKGIFVSSSAGNGGPSRGTLSNEAPWVLTVGASSIDRTIGATVRLGNGVEIRGQSAHQPADFPPASLPLVMPVSMISPTFRCAPGSLGRYDVKGKVVVCDVSEDMHPIEAGMTVADAGGAAMILVNTKQQGYTTSTDMHVLPASHVSYADGRKIKSYVESEPKTATASISFDGTVTGEAVQAPAVAATSSRGPNQGHPSILKPDILGPGVNILAAWPSAVGTPGVHYNYISGTSFSTPHLAGIAALLKKKHPLWSPAAIKSAIMTTAYNMTNDKKPIPDQNLHAADLFATGAGHVDPAAANDPGLVYDIAADDYIAYLCGLWAGNDAKVSAISRREIECSGVETISGKDLNYPTITASLSVGESVEVRRTVTNVGSPTSTYTARFDTPRGTTMTVSPTTISFSRLNEEATYTITFSAKKSANGQLSIENAVDGSQFGYSRGHLSWISSDSKYTVNSPILIAHTAISAQTM